MSEASKETRPVVCVFCGSAAGKSPAHTEAARALAHLFHKEGVKLVYGGGTSGLMGEIARTLVSLSGPDSVHGIIPSALVKIENGHRSTLTAASTNPLAQPLPGQPGVAADEEVAGKLPERTETTEANGVGPADKKSFVNAEYGVTTIVPDMHTRKRMMAGEVISGGPGSGFLVLPGGFGTIEEAMEMVTWNQLGIHHRGIVLLNIEGYWDGVLSWVEKSVEQGFVSTMNKDILVECKDVEHALEALRSYKLSQGRFGLSWEVELGNGK
ncbi:lysine decarboxylase-like protein [Arthroderma uncinatum]|uniref:lysine decarboxylase-like protein n=1 Tax=Arthroderma uncinatum TaxID=74035 RepID=UPI00144AB1B8|nr:lysine decarboxylase-like protein [Arthroderma uncinatum]KAF3483722.1 lysine decarboxylase-like protein [Arthroderma uncinatum]